MHPADWNTGYYWLPGPCFVVARNFVLHQTVIVTYLLLALIFLIEILILSRTANIAGIYVLMAYSLKKKIYMTFKLKVCIDLIPPL